MHNKLIAIFSVLLVLGGLGVAVARSQRLPEGPVPIAWDREACRHCHMHVGEPAFAAQLQTEDGQILDFDDPGCLLLFVDEQRPPVHAIWFHHLREDRWLPASQVGFVQAEPSPMGYGLGVVDRSEPGAISYEAAVGRAKSRVTVGLEGR